eukprot:Amastigsp_a178121_6.p4 type:complete len:122 gc:universal Amastigsp_a178121_6:374-739(+)
MAGRGLCVELGDGRPCRGDCGGLCACGAAGACSGGAFSLCSARAHDDVRGRAPCAAAWAAVPVGQVADADARAGDDAVSVARGVGPELQVARVHRRSPRVVHDAVVFHPPRLCAALGLARA